MTKKIWNLFRGVQKDESGVAAVEFAMASTMLMLLVLGTADLGMAMRHKSQLEAAVRAGMERALVDASENDLDLTSVESTVESFTGLPSGGSLNATATSFCKCVLVDEGGNNVTEDDTTDGTCTGYCDTGAGEERHTFVNVSVSQQHTFLFDFPGITNPMPMSIAMDVKVTEQQ